MRVVKRGLFLLDFTWCIIIIVVANIYFDNNFLDHHVGDLTHTASVAAAADNVSSNNAPTVEEESEVGRNPIKLANLTHTTEDDATDGATTSSTEEEKEAGRDTILANLTNTTAADTTAAIRSTKGEDKEVGRDIQVAIADKKRKEEEKLQQEIAEMLSRPNITYISPNLNGSNTDWGGVASICSSWDQQEQEHQLVNHQNEIGGILFNNSDWMCEEPTTSIGNKLGLYFQARTFAKLHGVSFHINPPCSKEDRSDNLIAWLPQNVIVNNNNNNNTNNAMVVPTFNITTTLEGMCKCGGPTAHSCQEGWPNLSNTWHYEIRSALQDWALSSSLRPLPSTNETTSTRSTSTTIEKGVATIHFRCGDLLDPDFIARGETGGMGFLKPYFYYKHLKGRNITAVHILTTPLNGCNKNANEREQDCKHGPSCKRIIGALISRLSSLMNLSKDSFKIYDHKSSLWSIHHIVFSDVTFCSPSTFCLFPSLGSNYAVHTASAMKFPAIQNTIPRALNDSFEYDDDGDYDNLIEVNKLPRNGTVEKVIELMMQSV